ncbi:MAG TPA: hypothetical protein ENK18_10815 [Deltaproteobacteria bacterium]|nr:hypothetical protein [Deltaproteobacteria bacterium]
MRVWVGAWLLAAGLSSAWAGAPEISRSKGRRDGVVVLWPRVVPATEDPELRGLAKRLQDRLYAAASEVVDYRRVDVRPEPERVCPRSGCRAPSVSVLLGHKGGGCVLVALVGPAGGSPLDVVPLVGEVELASERLAFRKAPESSMVITEFVPCDQIEAELDDQLVIQMIDAHVDVPGR